MAVRTNREYRNININFRAKEDDEYIVEGYATTFDEPYVMYEIDGVEYKEQISSDAFASCDMSDIVFLVNHEGTPFARNKNGTLEVSVDEKGLKVVADLSTTEETRECYLKIKSGLLDKMSWAFKIEEDTYNKKEHLRTITKVPKIYDVSVVTYPANPDTEISARDFFNGVIEKEKAERLALEQRRKKLQLKMKLEEIKNGN